MKSPKYLFLFLALLLFVGCSRAGEDEQSTYATKPIAPSESGRTTNAGDNKGFIADSNRQARPQSPIMQQVSLQQAGQSQSIAEAMNRKIIRNADLALEVSVPIGAQQKITSITESLGGFVVSSESKLRRSDDAAKQDVEVNLVVRVPALQFNTALEQIRAAGSRVIQEKVSGEDVTEEFIDLEARVKTQKGLEEQFLEIMKRANKVEDALEVQRQIAEVRTEIEKLEGRKRFLENRASLSTITVALQTPAAIIVNTSGFGRSVREAVSDSVNVAIAIVKFAIRFVIVMTPILLLIILPGLLLTRFVWRRTQKMRFGRAAEAEPADEPI